MYPEELGPPGRKQTTLLSGESGLVTLFTPRFERWSERLHGPVPRKINKRGEWVPDDYGGKPFVWVEGEPTFPELAILRLFERYESQPDERLEVIHSRPETVKRRAPILEELGYNVFSEP